MGGNNGSGPTRNIGSKEVERFLEVGMKVCLDTDISRQGARRYETTLLGWRRGKFLIFDGTLVAQERSQVISGYRSAIRFLSEGRPCAARVSLFEQRIERATPVFLTSWPEELRYTVVRASDRVKVKAPCRIKTTDGHDLPGELRDISLQGCRVYVPALLKPGDLVECSMDLPNGTVIGDVSLAVRHIVRMGEGCAAGCSFVELGDDSFRHLDFYLSAVQECRRQDQWATQQVLILSNDPGSITAQTGELNHSGFLSKVYTHVFPALAFLGISRVQAAFIDVRLAESDVRDFCRIIRTAPMCRDLPLYLFGDEPETLRSLTESLGTNDIVASLDHPGAFTDLLFALAVDDPPDDAPDRDGFEFSLSQ